MMRLLFIKAHAFGFLHLNLGCRDAPIQIQSLHSCTTPNVQWGNCRARLHLCPVGVLRSVSLVCSVTKALPRMLWWRQVSGHNNLSFSVAWPSWLPFCLFYFLSDWKCPVEYSEDQKKPKKNQQQQQKPSLNEPNQTGHETSTHIRQRE